METVIKRTADGFLTRTSNSGTWDSFIRSMEKNNTFCPNIKRVIFNLKTTETRPVLDAAGKPVTDDKGRVKRQQVAVTPVLATAVYFADGTKCTVVNSDKDAVETETKEVKIITCDADGKLVSKQTKRTVQVASESAKEAGVVYAIVKRLFGKVDNDSSSRTYGQIQGDGFGRKLQDVVAAGYDTQYEAAAREEERAASVEVHKERQARAAERRAKRRPTLEDNIATLVKQNAELIDKLAK